MRNTNNDGYSKKYRFSSFECFFAGFAAFSPDFDSFINKFVPMEHGVFSHTVLGALLFALAATLLVYPFVHGFPKGSRIAFGRLFLIAAVGVISHLLLDLVPYLPDDPVERAGEIDHHMYFWPLWDFPVHLNTIFSGYTYTMRVIVEVVYMVLLGSVLLYEWFAKRRLFAKSFYPPFWHHGTKANGLSWGAFALMYGLMCTSLFIVSGWWMGLAFTLTPIILIAFDRVLFS